MSKCSWRQFSFDELAFCLDLNAFTCDSKQDDEDDVERRSFYALMIGENVNPDTPHPSNSILLSTLFHAEDEEDPGSSCSPESVEIMRDALARNLNMKEGLCQVLHPFFIDAINRREAVDAFTSFLVKMHDSLQGQDVPLPDLILSFSSKDLIVAFLESSSFATQCQIASQLLVLGYPLPYYYTLLRENEVLRKNSLEVLRNALLTPSASLVLSCGTRDTAQGGKTFLLSRLIPMLATSSIDTKLLDGEENIAGPTHSPSIDLVLETKEPLGFSYADVHGFDRSLDFSVALGTLAYFSKAILIHVSKQDVTSDDTELSLSEDLHFLLFRQLALHDKTNKSAAIVFLVRDVSDGNRVSTTERAASTLQKALPTSNVTVRTVKNFSRYRKEAHRYQDVKQLTETLKESLSLVENDFTLPCIESIHVVHTALSVGWSIPPLSAHSVLGQRLIASLDSVWQRERRLAQIIFPFSSIASEMSELEEEEKNVMTCLAQQKLGDKTELDMKQIAKRKQLLVKRRASANSTGIMELFTEVITLKDPSRLLEFQKYLELWKTKFLVELRAKQQSVLLEMKVADDAKQALLEEDYRRLCKEIDEVNVTLDSFWAEMTEMYSAKSPNAFCDLLRIDCSTAKDLYFQCLKTRNIIPLLFGKPLRMAGTFVSDILEMIDAEQKADERLFVVSVIGIQSSGKSTLLNYLFGCGFATQSGRCTRGLYASFVRTAVGVNILVLDSEGLLSIEGGGREFDGKMTVMALACSDLVLINHKGEISTVLKDLLEICLYAMESLKLSQSQPKIAFILRDQRDIKCFQAQKTCLLKMEAALKDAMLSCEKDVKDLIKISQDCLFMLRSAFTVVQTKTKCVEVPSGDFSKQIFFLRQSILDMLKRQPLTSRAGSSKPLKDWYDRAQYVWKTLTKFGYSLLHYKTINEIRLRSELDGIVNEVLESLDNETHGLLRAASDLVLLAKEEITKARDEEALQDVSQRFRVNLSSMQEAIIRCLQQTFEEKTNHKQYTNIRSQCLNLFRCPVEQKCSSFMYTFRLFMNARKNEIGMEGIARQFAETIEILLQNRRDRMALKEEDLEDMFSNLWKRCEDDFSLRLLKTKESREEISDKVFRIFDNAIETTRHQVRNEKLVSIPIAVHHPRSIKSKFCLLNANTEEWKANYVDIIYTPRLVGERLSSVSEGVWQTFEKAILPSFQGKFATILHEEFTRLPETLSFEGFDRKMAKQAVTKVMAATDELEMDLRELGLILKRPHFLDDVFITLKLSAVDSLLEKQEQVLLMKRRELAAEKDLQKRNFLAILSQGKDDAERANAFALSYAKSLRSFVESQLTELRVKAKESIHKIFGYDQTMAAVRAYEISFGESNYRNVIKYCLNVNKFLRKEYVRQSKAEERSLLRSSGEQILEDVSEVFSSLQLSAHSWEKEIVFRGSSPVCIQNFKLWLNNCTEASSYFLSVVKHFPITANFHIKNIGIFVQSFRVKIKELLRILLNELKDILFPESLRSVREGVWEDCLRGCFARCPKCGAKCEGPSGHDGKHKVAPKRHLFPSFNRWAYKYASGDRVALGMCLDPNCLRLAVSKGDQVYKNFHEYLKAESPLWLPFDCNLDYAYPSQELKRAWVNCRKALLSLRSTPVSDNTPKDWIEAYLEPEREISVEDIETLKNELDEDD